MRNSAGRFRDSVSDSINERFVNPAKNWTSLACGGGTPVTAAKTALVVGTILVAINQGYLIFHGLMPPWYTIVLTYCVPYCVNTHGAVKSKIRQAHAAKDLIEKRWESHKLTTASKEAASLHDSISDVESQSSSTDHEKWKNAHLRQQSAHFFSKGGAGDSPNDTFKPSAPEGIEMRPPQDA